MICFQFLNHNIEHAPIVDRETGHKNRHETDDASKQDSEQEKNFIEVFVIHGL
jgi:hypothetical protein